MQSLRNLFSELFGESPTILYKVSQSVSHFHKTCLFDLVIELCRETYPYKAPGPTKTFLLSEEKGMKTGLFAVDLLIDSSLIARLQSVNPNLFLAKTSKNKKWKNGKTKQKNTVNGFVYTHSRYFQSLSITPKISFEVKIFYKKCFWIKYLFTLLALGDFFT